MASNNKRDLPEDLSPDRPVGQLRVAELEEIIESAVRRVVEGARPTKAPGLPPVVDGMMEVSEVDRARARKFARKLRLHVKGDK